MIQPCDQFFLPRYALRTYTHMAPRHLYLRIAVTHITGFRLWRQSPMWAVLQPRANDEAGNHPEAHRPKESSTRRPCRECARTIGGWEPLSAQAEIGPGALNKLSGLR